MCKNKMYIIKLYNCFPFFPLNSFYIINIYVSHYVHEYMRKKCEETTARTSAMISEDGAAVIFVHAHR